MKRMLTGCFRRGQSHGVSKALRVFFQSLKSCIVCPARVPPGTPPEAACPPCPPARPGARPGSSARDAPLAQVCKALLLGLLLAFAGPGRACEVGPEEIDLSGQWKFQLDWHDKGLLLGWHKPGFDDSAWGTMNVPGHWEEQGKTQVNRAWRQGQEGQYNGFAWYRRQFLLPEAWRHSDIFLEIGGVRDNDWAYVNGFMVGSTAEGDVPGIYERHRLYQLPRERPDLPLNFGPNAPNLLAIRVCDFRGPGGIWKSPVRLTTAPSEAVKGIVRFGQNVEVPEATVVNGDVVCVGGDARVDGKIKGNLVVALGDIRLGPRATVDGDLVHWGGRLHKDPTARISGEFVQIGGLTGPLRGALAGRLGSLGVRVPGVTTAARPAARWLISLLTLAVLAILAVALFPRQMSTMEQTVREHSGRSLLLGALFILLIPLATVALVFTIVGILLVPLEIMIVIIMFLGGYLAVALALGRRILELVWAGGAEKTLLAAVVGALILVGVRALPVVGAFLTVLAVVVGFGVAGVSALGTHPDFLWRRRRPIPPPAAVAPTRSTESPDTGV